MNICKVLTFNEEDRNSLLSRMVSDCKYYLGYGYRDKKYLWAKDERTQIEYMFTILLSLSKNYSGVSLEDVNKFAELMGVSVWTRYEFGGRWENREVIFALFRKWGDKKGDRLECYTYPVGDENKVKLFASTNRYINPMDFLLYCQYNYKY